MVKRRRGIPEPEAAYFLRQLLLGVEHMHRHHVVHRDLKLGNLLLTRRMLLKIGDFGLAAVLAEGERRQYAMTSFYRQ